MDAYRLEVVETPEQLAERAAEEFESALRSAVSATGRFAVALSGGKTPRAMLETLAARSIDWSDVHFFWSDERCVPPDDPASNFGMAREALLARIAVPPPNVHRMPGELPPQDGAAAYDAAVRAFFGGPPSFDLIYLGLGPDGHTASLFPGTAALRVTDRFCAANKVDGPVASPWRLTLTYAAINTGRRVAFLVEGSEKASVLRAVLHGKKDVARYPAQGIAPVSGDLLWLVDAAAARELESDAPSQPI